MTFVPSPPTDERPSQSKHTPDLAVLQAADGRVLAGVAITGLTFDLAVRSGFAGVAGAILFLIIPLVLAVSGRVRTRQSLAVLGLVPVFGIWLTLRESPWLLPLDVIAAITLLGTSAALSPSGSIFDVLIPEAVIRSIVVCGHVLATPSFLAKPLLDRRPRKLTHLAPAARGLLLAAPVVLVLGALLASSDSVFASLFQIHFNAANIATHCALFVIGAWMVGGVFRAASADTNRSAPRLPGKLGTIEAIITLASLVLLFGAFVTTQIVVWLGGAQAMLHKHGMTYAQHARHGFFQLLAVAVITLAILMLVRATTRQDAQPSGRLCILLMSEIAILLTLVIVAVAIQRLEMYEHAYGLTMLRLYSTVFACLIGTVFILFGISLARIGSSRSWFLGASTVCGLLVLLALNITNPEKLVVQRNIARASHSSVPFDIHYASTLSADAYPALVGNMNSLDPATRNRLKSQLCAAQSSQRYNGWAATNSSLSHATHLRNQLCRPS